MRGLLGLVCTWDEAHMMPQVAWQLFEFRKHMLLLSSAPAHQYSFCPCRYHAGCTPSASWPKMPCKGTQQQSAQSAICLCRSQDVKKQVQQQSLQQLQHSASGGLSCC